MLHLNHQNQNWCIGRRCHVILERGISRFWHGKHQALLKAKCKTCGFIYSFKSLHLSSTIAVLGSRCTMINVFSLLSKSTYSDGEELTLKHNYNSISKAIQERVRENTFTNSESQEKLYRREILVPRGWNGI